MPQVIVINGEVLYEGRTYATGDQFDLSDEFIEMLPHHVRRVAEIAAPEAIGHRARQKETA